MFAYTVEGHVREGQEVKTDIQRQLIQTYYDERLKFPCNIISYQIPHAE